MDSVALVAVSAKCAINASSPATSPVTARRGGEEERRLWCQQWRDDRLQRHAPCNMENYLNRQIERLLALRLLLLRLQLQSPQDVDADMTTGEGAAKAAPENSHESWCTATVFMTDVLPLPLQVLMTLVILTITLATLAQVPRKLAKVPKPTLPTSMEKRRLEIAVAFLEEMLRARRDKLAKFI
ncbi:hypothetical protein N7474_004279 [Penicillium riverlandense]|uniref:uncharacterized protein n=1 Tax=Penicillium riverlandense TaxID=1903569 RepID=UPI002546C6DF|nr:uncharacterized protein N7474_004279 [Penicillium riverlandense]KAJ5818688.1 hypothetical protein N7474_004279 [Penicillium riverlandense]